MRDRRGRSPEPRPLGDLLGDFRSEVAPVTLLAAVQMVWTDVVGDRIAAVTEVVEEREGVVTVECSSSVWAQELELMGPRIVRQIAGRLGEAAPDQLRFRTRS